VRENTEDIQMNGSTVTRFHIPTKIVRGIGAVEQLGDEAKALGAERVLVVTDENLIEAGLIEKVEESLKAAGIEAVVFDEGIPDPTAKLMEKGAEIISNGDFGVIIGVGGGSNIDAAKGMSVLASNPGSICDYEGSEKFANPPMPMIAVPTTAGTGSEVTYASVVTDTERDYKFVVWSSLIPPRVAILDPQMPATAPAMIRISAGMDALTHAVESYVSKNANPYSESLALSAIRLISENLRMSIADANNAEAMSNMQLAANMAGMAFTNTRLGIVHAIALPPSALFHVPHGIANAILLPYGMEFNLIGNPQKFTDIAYAMGENVEGLTLMEAAMLAADAVRDLASDIGAPRNLASVGVGEDAIPKMAEDGMKSGHLAVNPRQVNIEDVVKIFSDAL
jgi:alcohol dehydrogenase class IV